MRAAALGLILLALALSAWLARPTAPVENAGQAAPAAAAGDPQLRPRPVDEARADTNLTPADALNRATFALSDVYTPMPGYPAVTLFQPVDHDLAPDEARALFRRYRELHDCARASGMEADGAWEMRTGVAWLPPAELVRVRAGLQASVERLLGACARQGVPSGDNPFASLPAGYAMWAQLSAAASGDPAARLHYYSRLKRRADPETELRPLLRAALAGEPEDVPGIARVRLHGLPGAFGAAFDHAPLGARGSLARFDSEALWLLVACDLGMDCGPESVALDRLCLSHGLCGYPGLESAVRDGLISDEEAVETEFRRQWIVERVRTGQGASLFERVPLPRPRSPAGP